MLAGSLIRYAEKEKIEYIATSSSEVDITQEITFPEKITHIINCAAFTNVDLAEKEADQAYAVNATGAKNLAIFAQKNSAKLIHISTDYVFDGEKKEAYEEEDLAAPVNIYGKTKKIGEELIIDHTSDFLIIRTSWLFGQGKANCISKLYDLMKNNEKIYAVDDQVSIPTSCDDLAQAIFSLFSYQGILHFANKEKLSRYQLACYIHGQLKNELLCQEIVPVSASFFSSAAKRPNSSVLSTVKAEKSLGYTIPTWHSRVDQYLMDAHANIS